MLPHDAPVEKSWPPKIHHHRERANLEFSNFTATVVVVVVSSSKGGSGQSVTAELLCFLFNSSTKVVEALLPLTISNRLPLLSSFSSWRHTSVGYLIPRALVWLLRLTQLVFVFTTFFVWPLHLLLQWFIQKINAFRVNHHTRRGAPQTALSVSSPLSGCTQLPRTHHSLTWLERISGKSHFFTFNVVFFSFG